MTEAVFLEQLGDNLRIINIFVVLYDEGKRINEICQFESTAHQPSDRHYYYANSSCFERPAQSHVRRGTSWCIVLQS